jgi:hypothetical protein
MWALRKIGEDTRAWDFHRDVLPPPTRRQALRALLGR